MARRILGMDLGITSAHQAVVIDDTCTVVARAKAVPTRESLEDLEARALEDVDEGTELWVVIDPTGAAWLPVAAFFSERGHRVFRPDVEQTAALRKGLSKRKKTNRVDAEVLAKLAVWNRDALHELELARGEAAELDRVVRATVRLTEEIATRKRRIRDLARALMPMVGTAISKTIGRADLEVLRAYGNPFDLLECGIDGLTELISEVSRGEHGRAKAAAYVAAAEAAVALFDDTDAVAFDVLAEKLATEITLLEAAEASLKPLERRREQLYVKVDPDQLARSLPGIARVGAPLAVAFTGRATRFATGDRFASYVGLVPRPRQERRIARVSRSPRPATAR